MATHAGYGGAVFVGTDAVAEVKDFTLDITANTADTSTLNASGDDAGWAKVALTLKSWTASLNVIWDDADAGQGALTEGSSVQVKLYPRGTTAGYEIWEGAALVTGVSKTVAVDGLVEASITVTGNGHIDEQTI